MPVRGRLVLALILLLVSRALYGQVGEVFSGEVVGITDGDTIRVMRNGESVRVRLDGIDCPETRQDFSERARQLTSSLTFGEVVSVDVRDIDQYGRLVARVTVGGQDVSVALLDRLTHHVHILELNGESYRLEHSKKTRQPAVAPAS